MKNSITINTILFTLLLSFSVFGQISFEPAEKINREQGRLAWSSNFKLVGDYALIWDGEFLFTFTQSSEKEIILLKKQALKLSNKETKIVPYHNKNMFIFFPTPKYSTTTSHAEIYSFEEGGWQKVKDITLPDNFSELFGLYGDNYENLELHFTSDNHLLYPVVSNEQSLDMDIPIFSLNSDSIEVVQMLSVENSTLSLVYDGINERLLQLSKTETGVAFITIYDYSLQNGKFNLIVSKELSLKYLNSMGIISNLEGLVKLYFLNFELELSAMALDYSSLTMEYISKEENVLTHNSSQLIQYNNSLLSLTTGWYFSGNDFLGSYQKQFISNNLTAYSLQKNQLVVDIDIAQSLDEQYSKQQRLAVAEDSTLWLFQNGRGIAILDDSLTKRTIYLFDEKHNWFDAQIWSNKFNESMQSLTFNDEKGLYQVNLIQEKTLKFHGYDNLSDQIAGEKKLSGSTIVHTEFGSIVLGSDHGYSEAFTLFKTEKLANDFEFEPIELPTQIAGTRWHRFGHYITAFVYARNINTLFINLDTEKGYYSGLYALQFDDDLNIVMATQNNEDKSIYTDIYSSRYLYVNNHFVVISGDSLTSYEINMDGLLMKKHVNTLESGNWYFENSQPINHGVRAGKFIFRMDDSNKWYVIEVDQKGLFVERSLPDNIHDPHLKGENEYSSTIGCTLDFIDEYHAIFCENYYLVSEDKQSWQLLPQDIENFHLDLLYDTDLDVNHKALLIKDSYTQLFNIYRAPVVIENIEITMKSKETLELSLSDFVIDIDVDDVLNFSTSQPLQFVTVSEAGLLTIDNPDLGTYQLKIEVTDSHYLSVELPVLIKVQDEITPPIPPDNDVKVPTEHKSGGSVSFLLLFICFYYVRQIKVLNKYQC